MVFLFVAKSWGQNYIARLIDLDDCAAVRWRTAGCIPTSGDNDYRTMTPRYIYTPPSDKLVKFIKRK
jgi:hypothetical protein